MGICQHSLKLVALDFLSLSLGSWWVNMFFSTMRKMVDRNQKSHLNYGSLLQLGKLGTVLPSHSGSLMAQCCAQAWLHSSSVLISALSRHISREAHSVILVSTISLCSRATLVCTLLRPGRPTDRGPPSVKAWQLQCQCVGMC